MNSCTGPLVTFIRKHWHFYPLVPLLCFLLIFLLCVNKWESTDGWLPNEYTGINKMKMSAARVWTGYILRKTADSCRKHQGDFADAVSKGSPAQWSVVETWPSLGKFKLCRQSIWIFWTISLDIKVFPQLLDIIFLIWLQLPYRLWLFKILLCPNSIKVNLLLLWLIFK